MSKMKNIDLIFESRLGKAIQKWIFGFSDDYDQMTMFFNMMIRLAIINGVALGIYWRCIG